MHYLHACMESVLRFISYSLPGRYFAASVCTLASCIISKKVAESGAIQYCMSESILGGCLTRAAYNSSEFKKLFQPLAVKVRHDAGSYNCEVL